MSDREALLKRWVSQPPATPNIEYLRTAERRAAVEQTGSRSPVLDVASEAGVTAALDAEEIVRLDFSREASSHARDVLGDTVDRYEVTSPEAPSLPFDPDSFEAAVSIGPFDWKFLHTRALLDELHRVTRADGLTVFSVPTPRSPYAATSNDRNRFYSPAAARGLVSPDWMLVDADLIFQYPRPLHDAVNALPAGAQGPFVDAAWWLSEQLTARGQWARASYLVLGVRPLDYRQYLEDALACLFRPVAEDGFWDPDEGRLVRALEYEFDRDGSPTWHLDDSVEWRYAPFALAGLLRWRTSQVGDGRYDDKLRAALAHFADRLTSEEVRTAMPSYGLGPLTAAFALADDAFEERDHAATARELYRDAVDEYEFDHAEDSLLLFGWAHLYEQDGGENLQSDIRDALWTLNDKLTPEGLFAFENPTARRHQNQMYALWGLCRAVEVTGSTGYLDTAEQVLDYTVEHRMRDDGAFIWEDVPAVRRAKNAAAKRVGVRPPHWDFLYECHQTFFVNAVEQYYAAGGEKSYDDAVRRAMEWIYGRNSLGEDLTDRSGLGVPMRFLTVDGRMDVPDQMYKGTYEVGSYVMALTNLLVGEVADGRGGHEPRPT